MMLAGAVARFAIRLPLRQPNPSQAAGVKRADGCIAGAGWPSESHAVSHRYQVVAADLILVACRRLSTEALARHIAGSGAVDMAACRPAVGRSAFERVSF